MKLLKVTGLTTTYPYTIKQLRKDFPNVAFPSKPSLETLASFSVYPVTEEREAISETQYLVEQAPKLIEGKWVVKWIAQDYTEEQLASRTESRSKELKALRDAELLRTDWYAIRAYETGVPMDKEWADYRKALRDITSVEGFPDVTLPTAPDYVPNDIFPVAGNE